MKSFLLGAAAAALLVGVSGFMLYSHENAQTATVQEELDTTRAELADAKADDLRVYCRGVIDQFLGQPNASPEVIARNDEICMDIMSAGAPKGFRGP